MAGLGAFLGLTGFLAIIVSLVIFIIPLRGFKVLRPKAKWILGIGVVAFIIGLILTPSQPVAVSTPAPMPTPSEAPLRPKPAIAVEQKKARLDEARGLWRAIVAGSKPCDDTSKAVGAASRTGNVYRMYPALKEAEKLCAEASETIGALDAPDGFEEAVRKCAFGNDLKSRAYGKAATVIDGDVRPSAVTDAKEQLATAQSAGLFCAAAMIDAASKRGMSTEIFDKPS